jgi:serine/threonine-protein kinase
MGTVYRGEDLKTGKPVAVKSLKSDAVQYDANSLERFRREAEALARLNHPNIVKVLDTIEDGDQHYIVMEYHGRGDLRKIIEADAPLPIDVTWSVAARGTGESDVRIVHTWDGPAWPLIRVPAAAWVIGPVFVHAIASRTLAGLARAVEAAHA